MRDADELHEALLSLIVVPAGEAELFQELVDANRATTLATAGCRFWVAAERVELVRRVYPNATLNPHTATASMRKIPESPERCAAEILRGWFECSGPKTAD